MLQVEAMARVLCEVDARGTPGMIGMSERQVRQHWYALSTDMRDAYRERARKAVRRYNELLQLSEPATPQNTGEETPT